MKAYPIRKMSGGNHPSGILTVPREVVTLIPDGMEFAPEIVEEGILYRRHAPAESALPDWVRRADAPASGRASK